MKFLIPTTFFTLRETVKMDICNTTEEEVNETTPVG